MGALGLPCVAELGHRLLLAVRDEDRVEAEAGRAARLPGDVPFELNLPMHRLLRLVGAKKNRYEYRG